MRVKSHYLGLLVLLLTMGVLATATLADYFRERITTESMSLVSTGDTLEALGLSVHSWYHPSTLYAGDTLQLFLRLKNVSTEPASNIELVDFKIPGFHPSAPCWPGALPLCQRVRNSWMVNPQLFPLSLGAGDAITVGGPLSPGRTVGSYVITGVLRWTGGGDTESVRSVRIGPAQVRARSIDFLILVGGAVKTLALPIILAILGVYFQRHQARRSMVLETWNQMLPKSHALAENHFLPISAWAERLHRELRDHLASRDGSEGCRKCFFYFAMLFRRMKKLRQEAGGFYFKSRSGERLASRAWALLNEGVERQPDKKSTEALLDKESKDALLDELDGDESYAAFGRKFLGPAEDLFSRTERAFKTWCTSGGAKSYLGVLRMFYCVLDCEMNRPYEFWYGEVERISKEECERVTEELEAAGESIPDDFVADAGRYLGLRRVRPRKKPKQPSTEPTGESGS